VQFVVPNARGTSISRPRDLLHFFGKNMSSILRFSLTGDPKVYRHEAILGFAKNDRIDFVITIQSE
jgi:hypothetical protein